MGFQVKAVPQAHGELGGINYLQTQSHLEARKLIFPSGTCQSLASESPEGDKHPEASWKEALADKGKAFCTSGTGGEAPGPCRAGTHGQDSAAESWGTLTPSASVSSCGHILNPTRSGPAPEILRERNPLLP